MAYARRGMRLTATPEFPPASCFLTGAGLGDQFIDTMVDIDSRAPVGRVYLSATIVRTMAMELLGMVPEEWLSEMTGTAERWKERAIAAEAALRDLSSARVQFAAALAAFDSLPDPPEVPVPEKPPAVELEQQFILACRAAEAQEALRSGALEFDPGNIVHAQLAPELAPGAEPEKPKRGRGKSKAEEKAEGVVDAIVAAAAAAKDDADGTTPAADGPGAAAEGGDPAGDETAEGEPSAEGATDADPAEA